MPSRTVRLAAVAYEAVALTAVLFAIWLSSLAALTTAEVTTGLAVSVGCALLAVAARRLLGQIWRPWAPWVRWLLPLIVAVPADTARLLLRVLPRLVRDRTRGGHLERVRPPVREEPSRAGFRRAWGTLLVSASPGTIVVDWPPDGADVVVHELGSGVPPMEKVVTR